MMLAILPHGLLSDCGSPLSNWLELAADNMGGANWSDNQGLTSTFAAHIGSTEYSNAMRDRRRFPEWCDRDPTRFQGL